MEKEQPTFEHIEHSYAITIDKEKATGRGDFELAMKDLKKVAREGITMAGGPAAILLQIAHPAVGQGVADHSTFTSRAISRAQYTQMYIYTMIFGNDEQKAAVKAWVDKAHSRIVGDGKVSYNAKDPELQLWVAATIYAAMVGMYELIYGALPPARAERVYKAFSIMGTSLQLPHDMWPADLKAFRAYWKDMTENHLQVSPDAKRVLKEIFHPKGLPLWARPIVTVAMPFVRPVTIEQLPPGVREQFDLKSTRTSRAIAGIFISGMSSVYPFIPLFLRQAQKTYYMRLLKKRMAKRGGQLTKP
ncbi:hypothetical protein FQN50_003503 [Emmonsiellopsis sp. PD_5]|nr:hypothetical protein FQN50_003503 [Emmonsiellopsis sp. PD_5]